MRYAPILAVFALIVWGSPVRADDFAAGYAAYKQRDYATAERIWQPLAAHGVAAAQLAYGLLHYHGNGVARDHATAVRWINAAAEQDFQAAQIVMATIHYEGDGAPRDLAIAARWFRRAGEQGDTHAQYMLGAMHRDGEGVQNNLVLAYMWFDLSARGGHRAAAVSRDAIAEKLPWRYLDRARSLVRDRLRQSRERAAR